MKSITRTSLTGAAVAAALGIALAPAVSVADGGDRHVYHNRGDRGHGGHGHRMIERYDTNDDGALTQAEIDAAREERRARFDSNADGVLTLEEYQALWLDARRERMVDGFQALDADGDGVVTIEEYQRPARNMVARLDRDGDDKLTREDMRKRGKKHRRGHDDDDR